MMVEGGRGEGGKGVREKCIAPKIPLQLRKKIKNFYFCNLNVVTSYYLPNLIENDFGKVVSQIFTEIEMTRNVSLSVKLNRVMWVSFISAFHNYSKLFTFFFFFCFLFFFLFFVFVLFWFGLVWFSTHPLLRIIIHFYIGLLPERPAGIATSTVPGEPVTGVAGKYQ